MQDTQKEFLLGEEALRRKSSPKKSASFKHLVVVPACLLIAGFSVFKLWNSCHLHHRNHKTGSFFKSHSPSYTLEEYYSTLDTIFDNEVSTEHIKEYFHHYTSKVLLAGTEEAKNEAEWTAEKWKELGVPDVKISTYYPYLSHPVSSSVEVVFPPKYAYKAKMEEAVVDEDPQSKDPNVVRPFLAYSPSGSVTGPLLYANYGRFEDFQRLVEKGVVINGTVAIMRYGKIFRGLKVGIAESFGCIGAIIYSDPADDGYAKGNVYPEGPFRPPTGIQRGSSKYMSIAPGDPLTPGYPATKNATRIPQEKATSLPTIPAVPISYSDAIPLLQGTILGIEIQDWKGALENVSYATGPGPARAKVEVLNIDGVLPVYNVIGEFPGWDKQNEEVVVVGNHRDAWVYGGVDPHSGSSIMTEIIRVLGSLYRENKWQPRRTVIFASWDGEEHGLLGSTEWVEEYAPMLRDKAVTYINVDSGAAGPYLNVGACPSLYSFIRKLCEKHEWPQVEKEWLHYFNSSHDSSPKANKPIFSLLGTGSDYTAFASYLGIPSISFSLKLEMADSSMGVYHSNYDSIHWYEKFGDPHYTQSKGLASFWGKMVTRFSSDILLQLNYTEYAEVLIRELSKLQGSQEAGVRFTKSRVSFVELEEALDDLWLISYTMQSMVDNTFALIGAFGEECFLRPNREGVPPKKHHWRWESGSKEAMFKDSHCSKLREIIHRHNKKLVDIEKKFLIEEGLEGRPWYKHIGIAPGLWTGYDAQAFPMIYENLKLGEVGLAQEAIQQAANVIESVIEAMGP